MQVEVEIPHTYVGDLVVSLEHLGARTTLHYREGGNADNLIRTYDVAGFAGIASKGGWTLHVSDNAAADAGRIARWRLVLVPASTTSNLPVPGPGHDYATTPNLAIPDNNAQGVSSTLSVPDTFTVGGVRVGVDIDHSYIGDLIVALVHGTVSATLSFRAGGSADDLVRSFDTTVFNGLPASGDWQLVVSDAAAADVGTLRGWKLTVLEGTASTGSTREFAVAPGAPIPDNDAAGLSSTIRVAEPLVIGGLRVAVDIQHTYIGDLVVTLTGNGTTAVLHNRGGGDADGLVRWFDLPQFVGMTASGGWVLRVQDTAAIDTGVLRGWRLIVTPQQ